MYSVDNQSERDRLENEAEIFSIMMTSEILEKLYIRDSIGPDEYTESCLKLITQFKSSLTTLDRAFDLTTFMSDLKLNCPSAYHRLHEIGMPATLEHDSAKGNHAKGSEAKAVAKVVHSFLTLMDALKLGLVTVEHVHPLLSELLRNINRASDVPQGIRENIKSWLITMNKRRPTDSLSEEEAETMARQVEEAHDQFYKSISA